MPRVSVVRDTLPRANDTASLKSLFPALVRPVQVVRWPRMTGRTIYAFMPQGCVRANFHAHYSAIWCGVKGEQSLKKYFAKSETLYTLKGLHTNSLRDIERFAASIEVTEEFNISGWPGDW